MIAGRNTIKKTTVLVDRSVILEGSDSCIGTVLDRFVYSLIDRLDRPYVSIFRGVLAGVALLPWLDRVQPPSAISDEGDYGGEEHIVCDRCTLASRCVEHNSADHDEHKSRCGVHRQFRPDSGEARENEAQAAQNLGDSNDHVQGVVQLVHPLHKDRQAVRHYEVHDPYCNEIDPKHPLKYPEQCIPPRHSTPPHVDSRGR